MIRPKLVWMLPAAVVLVLSLGACGDDGGPTEASPTAQATGLSTPGPATTARVSPSPVGTSSAASTPAATAVVTPTVAQTASPPSELGPRVDFDMDPTGNSCPNDGITDCTIDFIDECVSVPNVGGTTFNLDVVITGLNNGFTAFNYNIYFDDQNFIIANQIHGNPLINLQMQSTGSQFIELSQDVPNPPGNQPYVGSPHHVGTGENDTSETTPPFTQGTLGRYELTVVEGAQSGLYDLTLEKPPLSAYLDQEWSEYRLDPITTGLIALGQDCP